MFLRHSKHSRLESSLRGRAWPPFVHRNRILPEILLLRAFAARGNVSLRYLEGVVVVRDRIAIWPIAAEEHSVLSEKIPDPVERRFVRWHVRGHPGIDEPPNFRSLDED